MTKKISTPIKSVLQRGTAKLHIDLVYAVKGGFWLTLGQGVATVAGLLATVIFANYLSEEAYGSYKYILSLYGIVTIFSLTGMHTAIVRSVARGEEGAMAAGILTSLRWSWIMILLAASVSGYYFFHGNQLLGWAGLVIAILAPFLSCVGYYNAFVNGKKDYRLHALFSLSYSIIPTFAVIAATLYTGNILFMFTIFLFSQLLVHVTHLFITLKKYHPTKSVSEKSLAYGKHLSFMNVLGGIAFQLDKILVWQHLGAAPLALYSVATAPPQQLRYLSKIMSTIALPRFSERSPRSLRVGVHRKAIVVFLGALILVSTYIFVAPAIFQIFFPKYLDALIYSQVFSLVILFFPSSLYQQALHAHIQKKALYVLQIGMPALKIAALVVLLPSYGLWGVFGAMFISEVVRAMLVIFFFQKMTRGYAGMQPS